MVMMIRGQVCHLCAKNVLLVSLFKVLQLAAVSLLHRPGVNVMVFPIVVIIIIFYIIIIAVIIIMIFPLFVCLMVYVYTVLADIVVVFVIRIQDNILYVACFSSFITYPGVVYLLCSEICFYIKVIPSLDLYAVVGSDVQSFRLYCTIQTTVGLDNVILM